MPDDGVPAARADGVTPLKILVIHNAYQQAGGEDVVVRRERRLLAAHGHDVSLYVESNHAVRSTWDRIRTALQAPYSFAARGRVAAEIRRVGPDVVHVHNFFPLLSPSIYDACRAARRPVVQTLHNYRLVSWNGFCLRPGDVCADSAATATPVPWRCALHACRRRNRAARGTVAVMLALHRALRTWTTKVDVYVAPTEFTRQMFIRGGFPAEKIVVKPHFVDPDPGQAQGRSRYALFVGRLSEEKGLRTLLAAWARLAKPIPLKVVGDGPLAPYLERVSRSSTAVEWLREQPGDRVVTLMKGARVLLFPSRSSETFGIVIAEAYAVGLPVIAARIEPTTSLVEHGRTGLLFRRDDPDDLAAMVTWLWTHPEERTAMSRAARREFEHKYAAPHNYQALMDIYVLAAARAAQRHGARSQDPCLTPRQDAYADGGEA
jgi:glycosyltransferase involved in cell wall biosynthesis